MNSRSAIEEIIESEVRGLCGTCAHRPSCMYFHASSKEVIQCELFESEVEPVHHPVSGLCRSCDHSRTCKLPGRIQSVWHCNEFS